MIHYDPFWEVVSNITRVVWNAIVHPVNLYVATYGGV